MRGTGYLWLALAIVAEVIGTSALRAADGFTRLVPSLVVVAGYSVAFYGLSMTLKTMPVGIVYAIWSGVGIVLITLVAMVLSPGARFRGGGGALAHHRRRGRAQPFLANAGALTGGAHRTAPCRDEGRARGQMPRESPHFPRTSTRMPDCTTTRLLVSPASSAASSQMLIAFGTSIPRFSASTNQAAAASTSGTSRSSRKYLSMALAPA
jgi:small multidrug resistance pump